MSNGATTAEPQAVEERDSAEDRFRRFLEGLDETDVATDRRRRAWETYLSLPMPSTKSEEWRYTDVSELRPVEDFEPVAPSPSASLPREELPEPVLEVLAGEQERSGVAVEVNGRTVHRTLDDDLAERGVVFARLHDLARERPKLLERWLYASDVAEMEAKFWSLHVALLTEGYLLYVPQGVAVPDPVHVLRWLDRDRALLSTHSLIVAEDGAEVTCMDEYLSPDLEAGSLSVNGMEVFGGRNATVRYLSLGRYGRGVEHFSVQHAMAGRDTKLSGFNVALGSDLTRADVTSHLEGPGSESEMLALWFGDGDQHFDHHTLQHHAAPHAYSDLLYKGALEGRAESVFRGLIRVDEGAQLTDAYQTNRNLLLSEESHAITLPNLEIEADDVRCSHGATVGQVDPAMLFYLMSRGLTRAQAERLLVFGFFDEVLDRMPVEGARRRIGEAIEQKIGL